MAVHIEQRYRRVGEGRELPARRDKNPREGRAANYAAHLRDTTLALVVTYVTGRADAASLRIPGPAHALVDEHWTWAWRTTIFFGVLSTGRLGLALAAPGAGRLVRLLLAAAAVLGLVLLFQTAERGGRLVYEHGVGVAAPHAP